MHDPVPESFDMRVYEVRQKSQNFLHKLSNKLTPSQLSDCESVAGTEKCVVFNH